MDEPRRRAQRAQQAQPDAQDIAAQDIAAQQTPAQTAPGDAPHRRRRVQPPTEAIPSEAMNGQAAKQPPQDTHRAEKKSPKKKRLGRMLMQALTGAAALLGLAAEAIVRLARRIRREHIRLAAMALCACVAIVSAWQVGSILLRSARTQRLNESLARQRAQAAQQQTPQHTASPTAAPTQEPIPETKPAAEAMPAQETDAPQAAATAVPDVVKTTLYRRVGGEALPEMEKMHQINHDLVGWIQIPDVLDLPVVYRDNSYYLTHDFDKKKNASGTIFLDESHPFREKTQNLLLHGHNMKDGTMFGRLAQYLYDDSYLRNHPFIYFDTLWDKEQYVIFAILDVSLELSDPRFFNYFTHDTFNSDAEFSMFVRQLQLRSQYAIPIDVEPSDALLMLSTCLEEDRLVIVCRRLREDETRSQLRTLIRMATRQ